MALSWGGALTASEPSPVAGATRFSIPAGTLDDALKAYAAQSKIQLLYAPDLVHGKQGKGLSGMYQRDQALALLLANHRLTPVAVNPNTYLLQTVQAPSRRQSTRARREQPRATAAAADSPALGLATVKVTGTRIPRVSLETTTLVTVISSDQIESAGHGTLYDLLRIQPGIFGHHPIAVSREGGASMQPMVSPSAASLYSLGPRATLFLVDGKRVASYGLVPSDLGAVSDLTAIPLSFIDRIEILRGSASAVYGADAMAGTVNIILKRHMQGGEARLLYGTAWDGAAATRSASLSFGAETRHGGSVFAAADILLREELPGDARSWHTHDLSRFDIVDHRALLGHSAYEGIIPPPHCALPGWRNDAATGFCLFDEPRARTLQPRIDRHALVAHWSQPFGNALQATVSARYSDITQALQAPPLIAAIQVAPEHPDYSGGDYGYDLRIHAYSDRGFLQNLTSSNTFDLSAGIDGGIGAWTWRADAGYSSNRVEARIDNVWLLGDFLANLNRYRFNGLPNSADVLDLVSTGITTGGDHRLRSLEASAEGPAFNLPGGAARATVGIEWRSGHTRTRPDPAQLDSDIALGAFNTVALDHRSRSTAAFAELALPLHRHFHVDLATRVDRHEWHGNRWLPKVAMKWMPSERLMFRAGTSFGYRVPSAQDLRSPLLHNNGNAVNVPDAPPFSPCGGWSGNCNVPLGSMANPDLRPETSRNSTIGMVWAPTDSFSLGIDRFRILRRREFDVSDPAAAPELFPQGLIRDATGRLIRINVFLDNIGHSDIRGWDVQANYFLPTINAGEFTLSLGAHHLEQHRRSTVLQTTAIDTAGHEIPRTTALASMRWHYRNRWTTTLSARHFGKTFAYDAGGECSPYQERVDKCRNPSATLLGLGLEYTGIERWTLTFDVANLANRAPVNYQYEREGYNVAFDDPYGRFFTVAAKYRF